MGLRAKTLALRSWRSAASLEVAFSPGMTVLAGPNASGKTNTVEALQLLTAGTSFRRPAPSDLVREGCDAARADLRLEGDGRVVDVRCDVQGRSKRFTRNNKPVRPSDVPGTLLSVLFTPDDLDLVKRSARYRRDELDAFGGQASRAFAEVCRSYARSIDQRNRLLKDDVVDRDLLEAWDASVALGGGTLLYHRLTLWRKLLALSSEVYGEIAAGEPLTGAYESSLGPLDPGATRDDLVALMAQGLADARDQDLRRRQTTVGPHRDDLVFLLRGRSARAFGSQGQQRSVVLAWKLAQVRFCEAQLGERPILLLDDVMSELDAARRSAVSAYVDNGIQTVVTTTHLGYFDDAALKNAEVVPYGA